MSSGHVFFASDFHLGVPDHDQSLIREKKIVSWLESIENQAEEIFLMGDVFDFWFEYKTVVPKGYVRLLGKLAELTDKGIPVHIFRGNHDVWAFDYLAKEVGVTLHRDPVIRIFNGKKFFLAHGDGLGPGDNGYKFLKKVFEMRLNQFLFRWLHPDIGTRMGLYFSKKSRIANIARENKPEYQLVVENEMLYHFSLSVLKENPDISYLIFGHRHVPVDATLNDHSKMVILGDWVTHFTFASFDGNSLELKHFEE
jgi:UDP-2,3-diacylglucosamine hydrolase